MYNIFILFISLASQHKGVKIYYGVEVNDAVVFNQHTRLEPEHRQATLVNEMVTDATLFNGIFLSFPKGQHIPPKCLSFIIRIGNRMRLLRDKQFILAVTPATLSYIAEQGVSWRTLKPLIAHVYLWHHRPPIMHAPPYLNPLKDVDGLKTGPGPYFADETFSIEGWSYSLPYIYMYIIT
jgi:hypothetical protein